MEGSGMESINDVVSGLNECFINELWEAGIIDETKEMMDFATSKEWIETVEYGSRQEVIDTLGTGIDSMTQKMLGIIGSDVSITMPVEMIDWIKASTILWIKNKGAGNSMTEGLVIE